MLLHVGHVIVGIDLTEQLKPSRVARLGKDLAAAREILERLNAIRPQLHG